MQNPKSYLAPVIKRRGKDLVNEWLSKQGCSFHFPFLQSVESPETNLDCFFPGDFVAITGASGTGKATVLRLACIVSALPKYYHARDENGNFVSVALGGQDRPVYYFDTNFSFNVGYLQIELEAWLSRIFAPYGAEPFVKTALEVLFKQTLFRIKVFIIESPFQILAGLITEEQNSESFMGSTIIIGELAPPLQHFLSKPSFESTIPPWLNRDKSEWQGDLASWKAYKAIQKSILPSEIISPLLCEMSSPLTVFPIPFNMYSFFKILASHPLVKKSVLFVCQIDNLSARNFSMWNDLATHRFHFSVQEIRESNTLIKAQCRFYDSSTKDSFLSSGVFAITDQGLAIVS